MGIQFAENSFYHAQFSGNNKYVLEQDLRNEIEKKPLVFSYSTVNFTEFHQEYKTVHRGVKALALRKIVVIPFAFGNTAMAIYYLAAALFFAASNQKATHQNRALSLHSAIEAIGLLTTVFCDSRGEYLVEKSQFEKTCIQIVNDDKSKLASGKTTAPPSPSPEAVQSLPIDREEVDINRPSDSSTEKREEKEEVISNDQNICELIGSLTEVNLEINIFDVMIKLSKARLSFRAADVKSKSFPFNDSVAKTLEAYELLVKDSFTISKKFVDSSIGFMQRLSSFFSSLRNPDYAVTLSIINELEKETKEMAEIFEQSIEPMKALSKQSQQVLLGIDTYLKNSGKKRTDEILTSLVEAIDLVSEVEEAFKKINSSFLSLDESYKKLRQIIDQNQNQEVSNKATRNLDLKLIPIDEMNSIFDETMKQFPSKESAEETLRQILFSES